MKYSILGKMHKRAGSYRRGNARANGEAGGTIREVRA